MPGATHFGGWSEIGATVVKGASGGEMSDLRSGAAYSGIGGSGYGATVVGEVSESEESDFLCASRRRSGAALVASMIFSRLAVEIFLSLAQDCHLTKSRSIQIRFIVSEGSRKSSNSVEANGTGAAGLLGSGIPESSRSDRIAGRVMGPKGRASRRNVVSGSEYGATSDMVAPRSSGGPRGDGLFIAGVPRPMAP